MAHEIETKVLDISVDEIIKKLMSLGAEKTQETRLSVAWYRPKGIKEGKDPWFLRIRSNSEGINTVTWKAKSDILGTARKHKEIDFKIEEKEKLSDLFEELDLEIYAFQEKDRISFKLDDWVIEIDQYPKMPAFLEIEGNSEKHVNEAIERLGLKENKTWADGERTLIQNTYGLDWYNMKF
jgi:adenylate cyclase, class 2